MVLRSLITVGKLLDSQRVVDYKCASGEDDMPCAPWSHQSPLSRKDLTLAILFCM